MQHQFVNKLFRKDISEHNSFESEMVISQIMID